MISVPGKIARAGGRTVIVPELAIDREITRQEIQTVEIRLFDGREISPEQRRKISLLLEISHGIPDMNRNTCGSC